jgi:solute:Na+ symporter, SSS family
MKLLPHSRLILLTALFAPAVWCAGLGEVLNWDQLAPLPDPVGFAAPFAGVSEGQLLVGGGANFPDGRPWDGASKIWHDSVFALESPGAEWRRVGSLPRPLGYGVSITLPGGVLCVGGSDANSHHSDTFLLRLDGDRVLVEELPPLPYPLANACGALLDGVVHVFGGQTDPSARPLDRLLMLDPANLDAGWVELEPLPGAPRMLATAGVLDGAFYAFGGTDLVPAEDGGLRRVYLQDAWRYAPKTGWQQLADMPVPLVASPSPAIPGGSAHLLVPGGDDGSLAGEFLRLKDDHPGFTRDVLAYHVITDTWAVAGQMPYDLGPDPALNPNAGIWPTVTVPVVQWRGQWVIPSGEVRPGVRTPRVLTAELARERAPVGMANMVTLVIYLVAMLGIGFYFSRKERSTDRFFRGGQTIPWWAVGMSIYATMLSSITFMSLPAKAYVTDWSYFFVNLAIVAIAPVVIMIYLPFYRRLDITSAYEYLEKRFNLAVRLFGSASFILLHIGRMAIVLYLPAIALATVSALDVYTCILLMAVLCIIYTMLGGIEAVIWADVVQTFVLLGGALVSLFLILSVTDGGISGLYAMARSEGKLFENTVWWSSDLAVGSIAVLFFGSLFTNLISYTAGQDVVQRYMTTPSQEKAARSIWTNALLAMPGTILFLLLGTAFFVFYKAHPERLSTDIANDQILPLFVVRELPAGIAGLVIAGIMAASQSTLSSSLNSISAAYMTDFHHRFIARRSEHHSVFLARAVVLVAGALATAVACMIVPLGLASLFDAFIAVIGLTGGALGGLFALGIFIRRAHGHGALIGALTSIAVLFLVRTHTSVNVFLFGFIGMTTCLLVGYVASLLIPCQGKPVDGLTLFGRDPAK